MKAKYFYLTIALIVTISSCTPEKETNIRYRSFEESSDSYSFVYEAGNWEYPDYTSGYTSFGNHRFKIDIGNSTAEFQRVKFNPRRCDIDPLDKAIIVVDASSGEKVLSSHVLESDREHIDLVFKSNPGSIEYFVYYLPHKCSGGYYPTVKYIKSEETTTDAWLSEQGISADEIAELPVAKVISAQSLDDFHSFFPMEVVASKDEIEEFIESNPSEYYLFPEYRQYPIRMRDFLPLRWMKNGVNGLKDQVDRGEYYTFQAGVYSQEHILSDLHIEYTGLAGRGGKIPADRFTCFNTEGIDLNGIPFKKDVKVEQGNVQSLWFGVDLQEDIKPGTYTGSVIIQPGGLKADTVYLSLEVSNKVAVDHGDNSPEMMTRMRWLNSTVGVDKDYIIDPYIPVEINERTISVLGRDVVLNDYGLPENIDSYFSQEMTFLNEEAEQILESPISLDVIDEDGNKLSWQKSAYNVEQESRGAVVWNTSNISDLFEMKVDGRVEYDGMLDYKIKLIAREDADLKDIKLNIPYREEVAEYILGLGYKGQKLPEKVDWKWEVKNHQEGAWLGTINKGLQYVLRDENYERPLNTNFYQDKPLNMPPSWYNEGRGGITIKSNNGVSLAENYCGPRSVSKGDTLNFNIRFLITPFRTIDLKSHFNTRFVHKYIPVDSVIALHGTIVNVHHANEINPYINYPFYNIEEQKAYIDEAHSKGIKVKLYNTIRELSYRAYELFALRSLGDEILNTGKGGGHSWLQEHLRKDYYSAWHATRVNDAAILNKGNSRWTNYYIEGVNWLAKNQGMDGLYLDDIAFSRSTVKRIANVLSKNRGSYVIDLHSANQYNPRDGFINSAFLYMEHFPYVTRLWFGEYFDYYADPDYWFAEVSGLPFGLTGEMLQDGGRPYHGLIYGMTTRVYGNYNPSEIWTLFDDFEIAESRMLGYWVDSSPIRTDNEKVRSTVYIKDDKAMIVLASWLDSDKEIALDIDWQKLGMDKTKIKLYSPDMGDMQEYAEFDYSKIRVPAQSGLVLILE